jgi:prepilin-type N-terminal cleavage/methylation domain-containing protein
MRDTMRSDRGFTLIELIVASMLSVLVLSIVVGMMISSFSTERIVQGSNESSSLGQLAASSISRGTRHASALELSAPTADSQLLRALIVDDVLPTPVTAHCESWYYGGGEVRTERSASAIPVPTSAADVASWTLLADGVAPVASTPVLAISGLTVDLTMQLTTGDGLTVLIDTTAVSRQPGEVPTEVENLCF